MIRISLIVLALAATAHAQLPSNYQLERDWLLTTDPPTATVTTDKQANTVTLTNGLIARTIDLTTGTTIAVYNPTDREITKTIHGAPSHDDTIPLG